MSVLTSNSATLAGTVHGSLERESSEIQDALESDVSSEPFGSLPVSADVLRRIATAAVTSRPPTSSRTQAASPPIRSEGSPRKRSRPAHSEISSISATPGSRSRQGVQLSIDPEPLQVFDDTHIQYAPPSPAVVRDLSIETTNEEPRQPQKKKRRVTNVSVPVEPEPIAVRKRTRVSKAP